MIRYLPAPAFLAAAILAAALFAAGPARADASVKAGFLNCNVGSGWGFVLGSTKDLKCVYKPAEGAAERYKGKIRKFGLDLGYTEGGTLIWTVFAPTYDIPTGALAGVYVGASAQATVALGLGANALIGGIDNSIALQPLSLQGQQGLNAAAGIGAIDLEHFTGEPE